MLYRSLLFLALAGGVGASDLDTVGVTTLRVIAPTLLGTGVQTAQSEVGSPTWEVNPATVGQPLGLFSWISSSGTVTNFPNALGQESGHADGVGNAFYGNAAGVAPGVAHVNNYEATYFVFTLVPNQTAIAAKVVNQSFIVGDQAATTVNQNYDNYTAHYNTLFVSGVGNSGAVHAPATACNGVGVGAFGGGSGIGPTADGRCKPDLTAPASLTSYATPLVAGAAALLVQAGTRGDGGPGSATAATDSRTIKALLLNGAEKPPGWTNDSTMPLDARYGAGVLNVFGSYRQLRGRQQVPSLAAAVAVGDPHPPPAVTNMIPCRRGWDYATIFSSAASNGVNHYFFRLQSVTNRVFQLAATLVWQRQLNRSSINDLDLFLYNADDLTLVAASVSPGNNVEHLWATNLPPGRYDLQVLKHGAAGKRITNDETYGLAFEFGPPEPAQLFAGIGTNGQFQCRLVGEASQAYVVQGTGNFRDWVSVLTNLTSVQGFFDFTNGPAGRAELHYYRAVGLR